VQLLDASESSIPTVHADQHDSHNIRSYNGSILSVLVNQNY